MVKHQSVPERLELRMVQRGHGPEREAADHRTASVPDGSSPVRMAAAVTVDICRVPPTVIILRKTGPYFPNKNPVRDAISQTRRLEGEVKRLVLGDRARRGRSHSPGTGPRLAPSSTPVAGEVPKTGMEKHTHFQRNETRSFFPLFTARKNQTLPL